jgi:hypothetical protein
MRAFSRYPATLIFFNIPYVHAVEDYGTGYVHIKSVEKTPMRPITVRKYTIKQLLSVGTKRLLGGLVERRGNTREAG